MRSTFRNRVFRLALWGALGLLPAGCIIPTTSCYQQPLTPPEDVPAPHAPVPCPAPGEPLGLDQLLALADQNHPDLAIAVARTEAARGRLIQAGLYPNPTFIWEGDEVGNRNGGGGTQGPIIGQTIITAHKLKLARAAAEAGLVAADWQTMTRWFEVMTRVRQAYFDVLAARAEVQASEEVVKIAEDGLSAVRKLLKAEIATQPDLLRAEVEEEQSQMRLRSAKQRANAAWKLLSTAIGIPDLPVGKLEGTLDGPVPEYEWEPVVSAVLTKSSELQEAQALVGQNERLLARAIAGRVPDLTVSARPFYNYIDHDTEVKVEVGAPLPLFNRNQGNIVAARADLDRSQFEVRQVELRLTDRLSNAFLRYRDAKQQAEAYQKSILPHALESLKLVRRGYEKQDPRYDYTAVLQAQQTLAQARLAYVQALGALRRAVVDIAGLLQEK
jgi:cobalt-zinc-cadmium efflux system outer membrane protein